MNPEQNAMTTVADRKDASRFAFGRNWRRFLSVLDDGRVLEAEASLRNLVGEVRIAGASFVDVGCGSGLFSLAAARMGASRVHSFDFDAESVACTSDLRSTYNRSDARWTVEQGSVLDEDYVNRLGQWDVVYSWGVLHHTGAMWNALEHVSKLVRPAGVLCIAIYNDQGAASRAWKTVKRMYNAGPIGRGAVVSIFVPFFVLRGLVFDLVRGKNPATRYREYRRVRGMSMTHDWVDWLGGYPFEVATPDNVFDFFHSRGFELERLRTCLGRHGCNEFVFRNNHDGRDWLRRP